MDALISTSHSQLHRGHSQMTSLKFDPKSTHIESVKIHSPLYHYPTPTRVTSCINYPAATCKKTDTQ